MKEQNVSGQSPQKKPKSKKVHKKGLNYIKKKHVVHGFSVISLMIMAPVYFTIAVLLIVVPRSDVSYIEKRNLAKMPEFTLDSYFSGEYTAKVTEYYDDTVPNRDHYKTVGYDFKSIFGIHTEDEVKIVGKPVEVVNKDTKKTDQSGNKQQTSAAKTDNKNNNGSKNNNNDQTSKPETSTAETSEETGNNKIDKEHDEYKEASNGLIVVKHEGHYRGLELFGGGTGETYAQALKNFHDDLGDGVRIYSMSAATASQYYLPPAYEQYSVDQKETMDEVSKLYGDAATYVDVITALGNHVNEDIYLRTDHHWSSLGAYYAAQEFAKVANVPFKDLKTYKKIKVTDEFSGTLAAWSEDANLTNDTEPFVYYEPDNYSKCTTTYYSMSLEDNGTGGFFNHVGDLEHSAYLTFMGGDSQVVKVNTDVKNGRKLMVIKDSYGNAIPGYLFGSFEEICVVDMRYFEKNLVQYAKDEGITDMLFAMTTFSTVGGNADNLETLRTQ